MPNLNATPQQYEFYRWLDQGQGNGVLEAVAGSGKTTSIIEGLNYIDDVEPVLLCSFTKLIATELQRRAQEAKFTNVTSTTLNALGWGICRRNIPGVQLDQFKTENILQWQLDNKGAMNYSGLDNKKLYQSLRGPVKKLVGLLKAYVVTDDVIARAEEIAAYHSVDLPEGQTKEAQHARDTLYERVSQVYAQGIDVTSMMDYDDMKFMPVYYKWNVPKYKWVIVDEVQDVNECDIQLIEKLHQAGGARVIGVGDRMQAIYLFRGALNDAMEIFQKRFNAKQMPLTVCWRCPSAIIEEGKKTNPAIEGPKPNPKGDGIVRTAETLEFLEQVRIGDYVICRTTAPLVKRCLKLVQNGIPAKVKGREIGRSLLTLIDKVVARMPQPFDGSSNAALLEFLPELSNYKVETVATLEAMKREDSAIRVQDECEALEYFCMEAYNVDGVANRISTLFTDDQEDDAIVLFLTGHKCKGLQNPRVWFLRPDLCPHPKAAQPHEQDQEIHIRHIIVTRAEAELVFVNKEKDEK